MIEEKFKLMKFICIAIAMFILGTSTLRVFKRKANDNECVAGILMIPILLFLSNVEV